jgi:hypothetical protein
MHYFPNDINLLNDKKKKLVIKIDSILSYRKKT